MGTSSRSASTSRGAREGWLVREGRVLASVEIPTTRRGRARGLLGRDGVEGALLLRPARSVHTFGMRFPVDVAFCDRGLRVLRLATVGRNRLPRPPRHTRAVLETEAGLLRRWGIRVGDVLELRGPESAGSEPTPPSGADGR